MNSVYSKSELGVMSIAFTNCFKVDKELTNTKQILEWMESAPRLIVEYEGRLKNEDVKLQNARMEMNEAAYNGNIQKLVKHLRHLYRNDPKTGNKPKWELIFHVANGIMSVQETIEHATTELLLGSKENDDTEEFSGVTQVKEVTEVQQVETSTSIPEAEPEHPMVEEEPTEQPVAEEVVTEQPVTEEVEPTVEEAVAVTEESPVEEAHEEPVSSSGNAEVEEPAQSLYKESEPVTNDNADNKNNSIMEENKMSQIDDLIKKANEANPEGTVNENTEVTPGAASNVTGAKETDAMNAAAANTLKETREVRKNWSKDNTLTAIVTRQKPAIFRRVDAGKTVGKVASKGATAEEKQKNAEERLNNFITLVTAGKAKNAEEYAALSQEDKIAGINFAGGDKDEAKTKNEIAKKKAAAIYDLLTRIAQDPEAEFEVFFPNTAEVNYPVKGYTLGNTSYPVGELAIELMDKSTGVVYAQGYVQANGNPVSKEAPQLTLAVATKTETAAATDGVAAAPKSKVNKLVVRPKNKKVFLQSGVDENGGVNKKVKFLMSGKKQTAAGEDVITTANFKAKVEVEGISYPATLSVYSLDESGAKTQTGTREDGTPVYKTRVVSVNLAVDVFAVAPEIGDEFVNEQVDISETFTKWGINRSTRDSVKDNGDITEGSQMQVFDVFTKLGSAMRQYDKSSFIKDMLNKAAEQQEADSAAANDELV